MVSKPTPTEKTDDARIGLRNLEIVVRWISSKCLGSSLEKGGGTDKEIGGQTDDARVKSPEGFVILSGETKRTRKGEPETDQTAHNYSNQKSTSS